MNASARFSRSVIVAQLLVIFLVPSYRDFELPSLPSSCRARKTEVPGVQVTPGIATESNIAKTRSYSMTGDTPQESGHTSGAESAEIQNPDSDDLSGYGTAVGEEKTVVADSGTASVWPSWLGAARPPGWFLSVSGEAAPPERSGTEPARADAAQSADASPADPPGRAVTSERAGVSAPTGPSMLTSVPERGEPDQDEWPAQSAADGWAERSPAQDEAVPAGWT